MSKYYVDQDGAYLGGFEGAEPPEGALEVPSAPADARQVWDGEAWGDVPVDLAAYTADKRWQIETGGITVGGAPVATDDRSKIMIIGARVKADADPNFTTEWKTPTGFVTLDATTIIAISNAVLAHVDASFAVEK